METQENQEQELISILDNLMKMDAIQYVTQMENCLVIMLPLEMLGKITPQMVGKYNLQPISIK